MSTSASPFVWYELMTSDPTAASAFYGQVIGWTTQPTGDPERGYALLSTGSRPVAGLMPIPAQACAGGARPCWTGYIRVEDVDAQLQRVVAAGSALHRGAEDITGVGRFAVVTDPQGAAFVLFREAGDMAPPPGPAPMTPGHIGWHELHAQDGVGAFAFYREQFGWTPVRAMDMGPLGVYQLFATGAQETGGIMTRMAATPVPFWLFYFIVEGIDAAIVRVQQAGGTILQGPMEVPGGNWVSQCLDPQGAAFAMVAPRR